MAVLYPPAQPSISGDVVTISRFLNNPTLVARRLRTLAEQRFISDVLLSGGSRPALGRCCTRPASRSTPIARPGRPARR